MTKADSPEATTTIPTEENANAVEPALREPDTLQLLQREMEIAPSVTSERKQELLVQARAARRQWIQQVPLPYQARQEERVDDTASSIWESSPTLRLWSRSALGMKLPGSTQVLADLYGLSSGISRPEQIEDRLDQLVRPFCITAYLLPL